MKKLHKKLHLLQPSDIAFDVNNPRGLRTEQIIHAPAFKQLVASIKEHGILEPLIVRADPERTDKFILIDGERRLRAAVEAENKEVPALLAKSDTDGRILAYQVHMLRDNWDKPAETKAIKTIVTDLKNDTPDITESELKREIKRITGHTSSDIDDLFRLMKYDDDTIDKAIKNELPMSYLIHIEQNFIRPLKKHYLDVYEKFGEHQLRAIMATKALDGNLVNTRFLMDKFKDVFSDTKNSAEIQKMLIKFLEKEEMSLKEVYDKQQKFRKRTAKKAKPKKTTPPKKSPDKESVTKETVFRPKKIKVSKKQQTQIYDVREKIENIGGTFSKAEYDYISEGLFCLERHCLKAAILMVWSTGINRILDYIERDLSEFNKASEDMKKDKRSVWRYFADNFQRNINSIEDIRMRSNDIQLLCYLTYKKIITVTQFNALRGNYQTRCDCAHPTDIDLTPNTTISLFDNVHDYILSNSKLK